jgi:hypothetical protein
VRKKNTTILYEISIYNGSDYDKNAARGRRGGGTGTSPLTLAVHAPRRGMAQEERRKFTT